MKQQWMNLKNSSKIIIVAALVAAIVIADIAVFSIYKRSQMGSRLKTLQEETQQADQDFTYKYRRVSNADKEILRSNLEAFFDSLLGRDDSYEFHSFNEVKGILHEYPSEYAYVVEYDEVYSLFNGRTAHGVEKFDEFVSNCRLGKPGYVVLSVFSINLDPIYYFIEYDGSSYHVVVDQTRDGFIDPYGYVENFGKYLKIQCYKDADGSITEYGFLTDDINVTYQQILDYYSSMARGNTDVIEPQYWQFLMISITKEDQKARMLSPNRLSKEFTTNYSGYADIHPDFADENPQEDYDQDGILDRIYREYVPTENDGSMVNLYMFLGNGNTISLTKNMWGTYFYTCMEDVTGDGNKDICLVQYDKGVNGNSYGISIFEYRNGNYVSMKLPQNKYSKLEIVSDGQDKAVLECAPIDNSNDVYTIYYENGEWKTR